MTELEIQLAAANDYIRSAYDCLRCGQDVAPPALCQCYADAARDGMSDFTRLCLSLALRSALGLKDKTALVESCGRAIEKTQAVAVQDRRRELERRDRITSALYGLTQRRWAVGTFPSEMELADAIRGVVRPNQPGEST